MRRTCALALTLAAVVWLLMAGVALADNCADPRDCYATDSAAARAGLALLALLLLYLLLQLLGRGSGGGWGWPGGGRDGLGARDPGDELEGVGPGVDGAGLTDRLLGWLDDAFGGGGPILGGRVGGSQDLLSGELLGAQGRLTVTGEGIAELTGSSSLQFDESGLAAQLGLEARVGAQAGLSGSLESGWITQTLAGDVFVGGLAGAEGGLQLDSGGLGLHGEAEAFVGGRATGSYGLETGPVTGNIGGSVSYGLGATAEGDVSFGWEGIGFSGRTGATLGLGAEADINISVDPSAVADGIGDALYYFGW